MNTKLNARHYVKRFTQIGSFNPLHNLQSWVLLQMRKCRHRAVGLRLMSTKRKTVIHTKALKLQSPVVCMTLHPPKLNT